MNRNLKNKLASILIVCTLILTSCGKKEENTITIEDVQEEIASHSLTEVIEIVGDNHNLDEMLDVIYFEESGKTIFDLEKEYEEAIKLENFRQADYIVSLMYKMVISSKVANFTGIDPQKVLTNIQLPSLEDICDLNASIKIYGQEYNISNLDKDQFTRLVLNYVNAYLSSIGYNRDYTPQARYSALKKAILTEEEIKIVNHLILKDEYNIEGSYSEHKIKKLLK